MSEKSLKYSHIKNCKGRAPAIPEPVFPEKPKAKPEPTLAAPITEQNKVVNDLLQTQSQTRQQQRQVIISLLISHAFQNYFILVYNNGIFRKTLSIRG